MHRVSLPTVSIYISLHRSVDGGIKRVARGLKKGAESVKGGVAHAFEGGHERDEPAQGSAQGADGAAPNKATRTAGGGGGVGGSGVGGGGGGGGGAREAVANLHERGEKLETLKSAVDGLAAEAEAFAASAHRLNK